MFLLLTFLNFTPILVSLRAFLHFSLLGKETKVNYYLGVIELDTRTYSKLAEMEGDALIVLMAAFQRNAEVEFFSSFMAEFIRTNQQATNVPLDASRLVEW